MRLALLPPAPIDGDAGARNVRLLSVLRLLAIGGQLGTILVVHLLFGAHLPLVPMISAVAVLAALNLAIAHVASRRPISDRALFATMLVDVGCLTVQLYLSGGVSNPFVWLYLLQVVIAAVLLPAWAGWALMALTSASFGWLAASPHRLPPDFGAALSPPYVAAAWISYTLTGILLVNFVTRIVRNLAERDARLAALRQRAAEEEHVVRMGLLASGAAHELGTPLASVAVMLGDWKRDPVVRGAPELLGDVAEMSAEIARCKDILGQVLANAGEVRGDAPIRTTLSAFIRHTVEAWRTSHDVVVRLSDKRTDDPPMVADKPLAQTIVNLLDNAAEAGARTIDIAITAEDGQVQVAVRDDGRGFAPAVLPEFAKPYRTTKDRDGAGLGLFLASNVLRTLGGTVEARNRPGGGAEVTLTWPLAATAAAEQA